MVREESVPAASSRQQASGQPLNIGHGEPHGDIVQRVSPYQELYTWTGIILYEGWEVRDCCVRPTGG